MKKLQAEIRDFTNETKTNIAVHDRLLDVVSEVGELAKSILKSTNYGKTTLEITDNMVEELGDSLYSLICLANTMDVDAQAAVLKVMEKYKQRFNTRKTLSS